MARVTVRRVPIPPARPCGCSDPERTKGRFGMIVVDGERVYACAGCLLDRDREHHHGWVVTSPEADYEAHQSDRGTLFGEAFEPRREHASRYST